MQESFLAAVLLDEFDEAIHVLVKWAALFQLILIRYLPILCLDPHPMRWYLRGVACVNVQICRATFSMLMLHVAIMYRGGVIVVELSVAVLVLEAILTLAPHLVLRHHAKVPVASLPDRRLADAVII